MTGNNIKEYFNALIKEENVTFCPITITIYIRPKNKSPCPENNVIKSRSGNVNSTSGVSRAIVPPPSPQK